MEHRTKPAELVGLGVHSVEDVCLARVNKTGFSLIESIELVNKGHGNVTFTLKKRGQSYTIAAEVITSLQVGATDRYRGKLAQRRVTPGTITILDSNAGVDQKVEDTNADGILWQVDGPVGPTYPIEVGTVDYNEGILDFTFNQAVTNPTTIDYKHTNWTAFGTPVTFDIVAAAGSRKYTILPDDAENYFDSLKEEIEFGIFAKKTASDQDNTVLGLIVWYFGDDSQITLPLVKGEILGTPYHNS
jgi:hypothetical protein